MTNMLYSVVGPTATGKTSFALQLAEVIISSNQAQGIDIISADSRQVYKGLEIISGADIPLGFTQQSNPALTYDFFSSENSTLSLHGISIISPDEEWSVAHFVKMADQILEFANQKERVVILVGGTGFYHQQFFQREQSLLIPPNHILRKDLETKSLDELQKKLKSVDTAVFQKLNRSDKHNPRRVMRAIEVATFKKEHKKLSSPQSPNILLKKNIFRTSLTATLELIERKIHGRIEMRLKQGAEKEVANLYKKYVDTGQPSFSATGVRELHQSSLGEKTLEEAKKDWFMREFQYAKRQITWWKKN